MLWVACLCCAQPAHVPVHTQLQGGVTQRVSCRMSEQCFVLSTPEMARPVETCPEMGIRRNRAEGCLGEQQSLEGAGWNESCFTKHCSSTGQLWFLPRDAFLCYCLHGVPKTAAISECLVCCWMPVCYCLSEHSPWLYSHLQ